MSGLPTSITTNNTIFGTCGRHYQKLGAVPLIADSSSDILSQPIPIEKYALIYAQKNIGPWRDAGNMTCCSRFPMILPTMLDSMRPTSKISPHNSPQYLWYLVSLTWFASGWHEKRWTGSTQQENEAAQAAGRCH